jgi:PilZ domain
MADEQSAKTLTCELEIEVFGADLDGRQFIEQTRTLTITRDGATIPLSNKLAPESELIVRNPATNQEAVAHVLDLAHDQNCVHVYGIAFADPSANLWQVEFPEIQARKPIVMECNHCHTVDAALLSDIESKIFEMKQALMRHCECCKSSTTWKRTDRTLSDQRTAKNKASGPQREIPPAAEPASSSGLGRRKEKRAAMKVAACIRDNRREEVVECEDVSRGGFRFKSREMYPAGMPIEAAVPFVKNGVNIFVAARIAYQQGLSEGFYRHGVAYMKSSKKPDSKS